MKYTNNNFIAATNRCFYIVMLLGLLTFTSSCDTWSTVRYTVSMQDQKVNENGQVVSLEHSEQATSVYKTAAEVANRYGLQKCNGHVCVSELCDARKDKSCEEYRAPNGEIQGYGAPVMQIFVQDDKHVIILITYFVGPTKPFIGLERDIKSSLSEKLGVVVNRSIN